MFKTKQNKTSKGDTMYKSIQEIKEKENKAK
jgi:hypothetical protein